MRVANDTRAAAVAALLLIAAAPAVPGWAAADTTTHDVDILDFQFQPDPVQIAVGDSVRWTNHDGAPHTATENDHEWDTGTLQQGESATLTFTQAGTWDYFCAFHPQMTATLIVLGAAPTVTIDTPAPGQSVSGTIQVTGTADSTAAALEHVEVRIAGGAWQSATGTQQWSLDWDTRTTANGPTLVEARAWDGQQHSEPAAVEVVVENTPFVDLEITAQDIQAPAPGPLDALGKDIQVTVRNKGNTDTGPFPLELEYGHDSDTHPIGSASLDLGPFSEATVTITWDTIGKMGDFPVTATADPDGATGDVDPSNNAATRTVSVLVAGIEGIDAMSLLP